MNIGDTSHVSNYIKSDIEDVKDIIDCLSSDIRKEIDDIRFSKEELTAIADTIYARRCEEHVMVLKDCPKNIKGGLGTFLYKINNKGRYIPPYCCQWCDMLCEPTASLKD